MFGFGKSNPMDTCERSLKERGWKYQRSDANTIVTGMTGQEGRSYYFSIRHDEQKKTLLFLFNPLRPDTEATRPLLIHTSAGLTEDEVAEIVALLMDENYRMVLGSFERDESDGEIRFRIALPYRDASPTLEQVNWCMMIAIATSEHVTAKVVSKLGESSSSGSWRV